MMLLLMYDQNVFASSALMYMNHEYTINLAHEYFSNGFNTLERRSIRLLFVWLYPIRFTQKNKSAAANLLTATISRFITDVMALFVHLTLSKLKLHKYLGGTRATEIQCSINSIRFLQSSFHRLSKLVMNVLLLLIPAIKWFSSYWSSAHQLIKFVIKMTMQHLHWSRFNVPNWTGYMKLRHFYAMNRIYLNRTKAALLADHHFIAHFPIMKNKLHLLLVLQL